MARPDRKAAFVLGATVLIAGTTLGIWAVASSSGTKADRQCVSVSIASATGGATVRRCGSEARAWCAAEASATGLVASELAVACRREGLSPRPKR